MTTSHLRTSLLLLCAALLVLPACDKLSAMTGHGEAPQANQSAAQHEPEPDGDAHRNRHHPIDGTNAAEIALNAAEMYADVLDANTAWTRGHDRSYFEPFASSQHPRITMVACADSRMHVDVLDGTPDGDVFEIRNIGNQLESTLGSVEYGVRHLHTPLLFIVGHVQCGAVKAAMSDYGEESRAIRGELDSLSLVVRGGDEVHDGDPDFSARWLENVKKNVNAQVARAIREFQPEIESGSLYVVGALYDFRGDLGASPGKLHVVSLNGVTDPTELARHPLVQLAERTRRQRLLSAERERDRAAARAGHPRLDPDGNPVEIPGDAPPSEAPEASRDVPVAHTPEELRRMVAAAQAQQPNAEGAEAPPAQAPAEHR